MENKEIAKSKESSPSRVTDASVYVNPCGLNDKQEAFCKFYVEQPLPRNATRAYMEAYGCSERAAGASVARLMSDARVQARIHALNSEFTAKHFISRDNVLAGFGGFISSVSAPLPFWTQKGARLQRKLSARGRTAKKR